MNLRERVLDAMRSGEWLPTQWIARVALGLGDKPWEPGYGLQVRRALGALEREGVVERRESVEERKSGIRLKRDEWRMAAPGETKDG